MRTRTVKGSVASLGAGLAALAIASAAAAPGAYAASSDSSDGVDVVNTETVQVYVEPDGSVESQRVYEQLTLTGTGTADIANPVEEQGLRDLNGFGSPDVEDGVENLEVDVDGVERLRSVSEYTGELPLDISVEYRLDGQLVEPGDVVGSDGELEVLYTAQNITSQPQEVSFPDGKGGTTTETVDVPIPMVGSLTTIVPPTFTEVTSDQANMAGDGKGGTKLSFTMTLFPPVGSDTAEFGYTAHVTDGVVPSSTVSALPVNPLESPSFKTAGESYQGGSQTGVKLAEGATTIDTNLLKLRDGAAKLLGGLIKLSDGADKLSAGLAGEAAPGARKLADGNAELDEGLGKIDEGAGKLAGGAGRLSDGAGQIDDGAGLLAGGAGQLSDGAVRLDDGANRLANGLTRAGTKAPLLLDGLQKVRAGLVLIDDGLVQLSTTLGPEVKASAGYQRLTGGIQQMINGIGQPNVPGQTLSYGLDQLRTKFSAAVPKIQQMADGVYNTDPGNPGAYQKLGCAAKTVELLNNGTGSADDPCFADIKAALDARQIPFAAIGTETNPVRKLVMSGLSGKLSAALPALATPDGATNETTLYGGLKTLLNQLTSQDPAAPGAIPTLTKLECAVDNTSLGPVCAAVHKNADGTAALGLLQGLQGVQQGIPALVDGVVAAVDKAVGTSADTPEDGTFRGGVNGLIDGVDRLSDGGDDLLEGLGLLSDGAGRLADGTGELSAGAEQLRDGAGRLSSGTAQLDAGAKALSDGALKLAGGTATASDGSGRLAAGADKLADGLVEASDGSVRLADGLAQAEDGAPALVDGAGRLSSEGMSKLIDAGEDTAQDYGKLYATLEAGAERADAEKMAYGAPAGARGLTAYTYEMLGDDGEGGRNITRGLAALGLLGAGGGAFFLRRRLL